MFRHMTIGKKIGVGFGIVLILTATLVLIATISVRSLLAQASKVDEANKLDQSMTDIEVAHLKWVDHVSAFLYDKSVTELDVQTDDHKCALGTWLYGDARKQAERTIPELVPVLKSMEEPHAHLHASAVAIENHFRQVDTELPALLAMREIDHLLWADRIRTLFLDRPETLDVETDPHACALGKWLDSDAVKAMSQADPELGTLLQACRAPHERLHESAKAIQKAWDANDEEAIAAALRIFEEQTQPALADVRSRIESCREHVRQGMEGVRAAKEVYAQQTIPALAELQGLIADVRDDVGKHADELDRQMATTSTTTQRGIVTVGVIACILGALLAYFIGRGIVKALRSIIAQLTDGANQVNDAAAQVSGASQQLATGASEQASSLEETSSALEEMAAMTRTNADNATKANASSAQAASTAREGDQTMAQLQEAMNGINESSERIGKIIKVIEEIAFQTNLLALNAAVEAARAGEHGKGFAVVADEVRNLAQRAAEAARETTGLIEDAVSRSRQGTQVAGEVANSLGAIVTEVGKVTDLIDGIAKASAEQAQGVDQVNTAVSEMDKVTQQNASSAEESASASEELSAQAQAVKGIVDELSVLVGGRERSGASKATPSPLQKSKPRVAMHAPVKTARPKQQGASAPGLATGAATHVDEFADLGEDDLAEF